MTVIDLGNGKVKLVADAAKKIIDTRTQRTYVEVICKAAQKRFFNDNGSKLNSDL